MMILIFPILLIYLETYVTIYVVYFLAVIIKRRKFPKYLVGVNLLVLIGLLYLHYAVKAQEVVFINGYVDGSKDWGSGLANVATTSINLFVVFLMATITQFIFWIFYKKLKDRSNKKLDLTNFLK